MLIDIQDPPSLLNIMVLALGWFSLNNGFGSPFDVYFSPELEVLAKLISFLQVHKILGPGNQYVTAAKMTLQVWGFPMLLV